MIFVRSNSYLYGPFTDANQAHRWVAEVGERLTSQPLVICEPKDPRRYNESTSKWERPD